MKEAQLIEAAERVADNAVASIIGEIRHEVDVRRGAPCWWAVFHLEMERTLPRWRIAARGVHRSMRRRMQAMCSADQRSKCGLGDD